jgi:hypothetical protein
VTNLLRGDTEDRAIDKGELLTQIMAALCMTEEHLLSCHGKTQTATVRKIIKSKFPNPGPTVKLADVDDSIINSIIRKLLA